MSISTTRIKNSVKSDIEDAIRPALQSAVDTQEATDLNVDQMAKEAAERIMDSQQNFIIDAIIKEIKENAEINVSSTLTAPLNLGEVTVLTGTFSQGAGAASVPNPAPVKIKINKIIIPKGNIK